MMQPLSIGVVGTGDIASRYLTGIAASPRLRLAGIAGRATSRKQQLAERFSIRATTIEQLVGDPAIDLVLNLSRPGDHVTVTAAALRADRHVYSEKPLAVRERDADDLIALAEARALTLACAPATALGPALQTARALIDDGGIGEVVGASATLVYPGPELFHVNPASLYATGAGPLFDMGVYDVAALIALLGPVARVSAMARQMQAERSIRVGPNAGLAFAVEVPTHVAALLAFAGGPIAAMTVSFDGFASQATGIEIYGTTGTLRLPRASAFDGEVLVSTRRDSWNQARLAPQGWGDDLWIIGLLDTADAIQQHRRPRCSAIIARHALAVLHGIAQACDGGGTERIGVTAERALPLEPGTYAIWRKPFPASAAT